MMECLKEVVGVTTSDCECIVDGLTTEQRQTLAKSVSGLYMDNLEGGVHMKAVRNADDCKSFYTMAIEARDNAIRRTEDDLIVSVNAKYTKEKKNFKGYIGRMSFAQSLAVSRPWQGIKITPVSFNDGVLTLKKLDIILNEAVTLNVRLFRVYIDSIMGEEIATWSVTTTANQYANVNIGSTPVNMPLVYKGEAVEYYVVYNTAEAGIPVAPKDNTLHCRTCDKGAQKYTDFVIATGVQFSDVNTLNNKMTDSNSHGLVLDVEVKCDNEVLICREYSADDAVAVTLSNAVLYKAMVFLIEAVAGSPNVNRYTTLDKTYYWGKRNHFEKEYNTRIQYLASVIDVTAGDCYVCRETMNQPFLAGIKS